MLLIVLLFILAAELLDPVLPQTTLELRVGFDATLAKDVDWGFCDGSGGGVGRFKLKEDVAEVG